jgi:hypothetical protein
MPEKMIKQPVATQHGMRSYRIPLLRAARSELEVQHTAGTI